MLERRRGTPRAEYSIQLRSARASLKGEDERQFREKRPSRHFIFETEGRPVKLTLPKPFLPQLNGGRQEHQGRQAKRLLKKLRRRQDVVAHVEINQDRRHARAIDFFLANWGLLSDLIHPHAKDFMEPRGFTEVRIPQGTGPIDFVGIARDGSIFVVEFGSTGGKHRQLQRYVNIFETLLPSHLGHIHPFVVKIENGDTDRNLVLRAEHLKLPVNGGLVPSGDRSPQ